MNARGIVVAVFALLTTLPAFMLAAEINKPFFNPKGFETGKNWLCPTVGNLEFAIYIGGATPSEVKLIRVSVTDIVRLAPNQHHISVHASVRLVQNTRKIFFSVFTHAHRTLVSSMGPTPLPSPPVPIPRYFNESDGPVPIVVMVASIIEELTWKSTNFL